MMKPPLSVLRHTAAELLGIAIVDLFPGAQLVDSGATEFGFFCDVYAEQPIDEQGLILLEEKLRGIVKSNLEIRTIEMMRENAAHYLEHHGQSFRADAVQKAKSNIVSLVQIGDFCDYSPSTYLSSTQEVGAFKLLAVETTTLYLEEEGEFLVKRIHGTAFTEKQSLKKYLKARAAGLKHDFRKIGKQMQLFTSENAVSDYAWTWLSQGVVLKDLLINWWKKEHAAQHFHLLSSPRLVKESLLTDAGAFDLFHEIYLPHSCEIEGVSYVIPPSLTPVHAAIFQEENRAINLLPIRYAECGAIIPGTKVGRYRGLQQTDLVEADFAHIFCNLEHLEEELISSLQFIDKIIKMFGFEYHWCFTEHRHKNRTPSDLKEKVLESFMAAFEKSGLSYVSEELEGGTTGPVALAKVTDSYGREWHGPKVSVDFKASEFLKKRREAADKTKPPVLVIVRSLFGSLERFIALLTEHFQGKFPFWLAPEQVRVVTVSEGRRGDAEEIGARLKREGVRVGISTHLEPFGKKFRDAKEVNVPYLLVVGDKEEDSNQVTLHSCSDESHHQVMTIEGLLKKFREEVMSQACPQEALKGDGKPL